MKKLFILYTLIIAALFVTSCANDDIRIEPTPPALQNGFLMKLDVQGSGMIGTRSTIPAEKGEEDVTSLYLLFFNAATGAFVDYIDMSPTEVDTDNEIVPLNMATPLRIDFTGKPLLDTDTEYRILVVANIPAYVSDEDTWLASFDGTLFSRAQASILNGNEVNRPISREELLMTSSIVRRSGQEMVHANLLRAMVRFDVKMDPRDSSGALTAHVLESVAVYNVPTSTALWNSDFNDFREHFELFDRNDQLDPSQTLYKGVLYSFENSVTGSYQNDNFTTALILGIKENASTDRVTYYRVNVNESGAQLLKRNYVYQVTVTRVRELGENTARDAYNGATTMLDINVRQWQDGGQSGVMFDGEDILAIGANRIDFDGDGASETVTIFSFSPNPETTLEIIGTDLPAGITVSPLVNNTITVTATPTDDARRGFINLAFGTMRGTIEVVQSDRKHLFLDLNVGTTEIPIFPKGDAASMDGDVVVSSSGPWTAELYNGKFTFGGIANAGSPVTTMTGDNGTPFTLSTIGPHTAAASHYAFVIVSLVADPNINRVLVLTQEGQAYINLVDPEQANLLFSPVGTAIGGVSAGLDYINVPITASDDWLFSVSGFASSNFTVTRPVGEDYLQIKTVGGNTHALDATAVITAYMVVDPTTRVLINLRQQAHSISLSPTTHPVIPNLGGSTQITVTSTSPWSYETPVIAGIDPAIHNVVVTRSGNVLTVTFPPLPAEMQGFTPTVTITAYIDAAPSVRESVIIQQGQRIIRDVNIVTGRPSFNSAWSAGTAAQRRPLQRLKTEIDNTANFSRTGGTNARPQFPQYAGTRTHISANPRWAVGSANVFLANNFSGTAAQGTAIRNWLASNPNNVLVVVNQSSQATGIRDLLGPLGFTGVSAGSQTLAYVPLTTPRTPPAVTPARENMFRFLLPNGAIAPFFNTGSVSLTPNGGTAGALSAFPNTFIPVIMNPRNTSQAVMGIDPTHRIVYIGNPGMFAAGNTATNRNWNNAANVAFVRNVAAWIMNTTQQGNEFTNQFK